ncbi:MAG: ribonuclease P protein component [Candidatus Omnitrophica bacterium]|nr:ribonuclease P protein component [Candidatus Omnitrophota bacterium]
MKKAISEVIKKGKKFETDNFIFYIGDVDSEMLKLCFKISKKYAGSVERNRIKRIFRDLIKKSLNKGDIVIKAKSSCQSLTKQSIEEQWKRILKQILLGQS